MAAIPPASGRHRRAEATQWPAQASTSDARPPAVHAVNSAFHTTRGIRAGEKITQRQGHHHTTSMWARNYNALATGRRHDATAACTAAPISTSTPQLGQPADALPFACRNHKPCLISGLWAGAHPPPAQRLAGAAAPPRGRAAPVPGQARMRACTGSRARPRPRQPARTAPQGSPAPRQMQTQG